MRAGEVNDLVKIYRLERVGDAFSSRSKQEYRLILTTRARRRFSSGGLDVNAHEVFHSNAVVFSFFRCYRACLKVGYIIESKDEKFKITNIEDNERYRCLIASTERIND